MTIEGRGKSKMAASAVDHRENGNRLPQPQESGWTKTRFRFAIHKCGVADRTEMEYVLGFVTERYLIRTQDTDSCRGFFGRFFWLAIACQSTSYF